MNKFLTVDNTLSVNELDIKYRMPNATLIDTGYNLIELGVIPKTKKYSEVK